MNGTSQKQIDYAIATRDSTLLEIERQLATASKSVASAETAIAARGTSALREEILLRARAVQTMHREYRDALVACNEASDLLDNVCLSMPDVMHYHYQRGNVDLVRSLAIDDDEFLSASRTLPHSNAGKIAAFVGRWLRG